VDAVIDEIRRLGGEVLLKCAAESVTAANGKATGVKTSEGEIEARAVLLTVPLPVSAALLADACSAEYVASLRKIRYLSNICIVLELSRSLSSTYWLNVNDPSFPFVAVIEHTNFEPPTSYGGRHIVYLSKYLPPEDALFRMSDDEAAEFAMAALGRMFPEFEQAWVTKSTVWRADYSQPIVGLHHSELIPAMQGELENLFLATMGQVYPEDRGTNYAVRGGVEAAGKIVVRLAEETEDQLPHSSQRRLEWGTGEVRNFCGKGQGRNHIC